MEWAYDGLQQIKVAVGHAAEVTPPSPQAPQAGEEWCEKVVAGVHLDLDDQTAGIWTTSTLRGALLDVAFTHRPMDLTSDEKAFVHAAIAGVMTSSR
ncbi:hypothetical protein OHA25_48730 [Nonomuraea sp. NBC_00507]|uniref:hypothetical protein n=1 Tax=Nonomuraea sp. NBC_00507 TaxID=2976002 RepID=UPI002E1783AE